jgi:hypothetical protein
MSMAKPITLYTKCHHIVEGQFWSPANVFSPREWEGKPSHSKQIAFADDITIIKVYKIEKRSVNDPHYYLNGKKIIDNDLLYFIARHEGLMGCDKQEYIDSLKCLTRWPSVFSGQIICWQDPSRDYLNQQYYEELIPQYQANA